MPGPLIGLAPIAYELALAATAAVAAAFLTGCSCEGDRGPAGPQGPQGEPGNANADGAPVTPGDGQVPVSSGASNACTYDEANNSLLCGDASVPLNNRGTGDAGGGDAVVDTTPAPQACTYDPVDNFLLCGDAGTIDLNRLGVPDGGGLPALAGEQCTYDPVDNFLLCGDAGTIDLNQVGEPGGPPGQFRFNPANCEYRWNEQFVAGGTSNYVSAFCDIDEFLFDGICNTESNLTLTSNRPVAPGQTCEPRSNPLNDAGVDDAGTYDAGISVPISAESAGWCCGITTPMPQDIYVMSIVQCCPVGK